MMRLPFGLRACAVCLHVVRSGRGGLHKGNGVPVTMTPEPAAAARRERRSPGYVLLTCTVSCFVSVALVRLVLATGTIRVSNGAG